MKRKGHLFIQITDINNCMHAIAETLEHKPKYQEEYKHLLLNPEKYATEMSMLMNNPNFAINYNRKTIIEKHSQKVRELSIPPIYPSQCIQHAVMRIVKPILLKGSYYYSCANLKDKGIRRACIGVEYATLRDIKHAKYCAQLDIKKFYENIDPEILINKLKTKIKDKRCIDLLSAIIYSNKNGLPLGNYTSPYLAEFYLQELDHFIKQHEIKIKHYVRYCDDMVLIHSNKKQLHKMVRDIKLFLNKNLNLTLKSNYQVYRIRYKTFDDQLNKPIYRGRSIDFVGRKFSINYTKIRKKTALSFIRTSNKIKKIYSKYKFIHRHLAASFISKASCLLHTSSTSLKRKYYNTLPIDNMKYSISSYSKSRQTVNKNLELIHNIYILPDLSYNTVLFLNKYYNRG